MQLSVQIDLWEYQHPEANNFLQSMIIDSRINRELLMDSMLMEIGELETIACNSEELHKRFEVFFRKWEIPISRLCDTVEYDYDPMLNVDYQVNRNLGRDVARQLGRDIVRELVSAIKTNFISTEGRNVTDSYNDNVDNTHNDLTKTAIDETDRHYVSAYNQITPADADTYSDRDTIERDENVDNNGSWNQKKTSTDTVRDDRDLTNDTDRSQDDTESTNTDENETIGTKESEGVHKKGIDKITNQELVESQRSVVQFSIINWIVDRIAKEIVVGVW